MQWENAILQSVVNYITLLQRIIFLNRRQRLHFNQTTARNNKYITTGHYYILIQKVDGPNISLI